jgi:hypothetical protein
MCCRLAVNEITQMGLGRSSPLRVRATAVRFVLREKPLHDIAGLRRPLRWPIGIAGLGAAAAASPPSRPTPRLWAKLYGIEPGT